ncbi:carbonic anhydrase family protein [Actinokineospora guangxiensis]|uniref:carbonic anhydrase n=1 Tax=Actinokineospora guangxiensis TaxID=1490288 RepID=A0ABW0EGM1_9PSEU
MTIKRVAATLVPLSLAVAMSVASGTTAQSQAPKQSPVNVTPNAVTVDPGQAPLLVTYGHSDLELHYVRKDQAQANGCTTRDHEETEEAEVEAGAGHVTLAGVRYDLVQFHFHTPSEHRFGGHSLPLEMHLVHKSAADQLLVIGVPLRAGARSSVDTVLATLAPECGTDVHLSDFDLNTLLPANRSTLRYQGSLTTAPFTEGVQWMLMAEKTVTQATITRFKNLFQNGNSRATQPLNGRDLTLVPQN